MIRCRLVYVARGGVLNRVSYTGEALPRGPIPYPTFYIPGLFDSRQGTRLVYLLLTNDSHFTYLT